MTYPPDPPGPQQPSGYPGNYPQAGYGYGPAGAPPPPPQPDQPRGRSPIQVGIVLLVLGLAVAIAGGVLAGANSLSKVNGFQRVAVKDATGKVTFNNAGGYVAYYESSAVSDNMKVPLIPGVLTNQVTGTTVKLQTTYGNRSDGKIKALRYDYNGHHGVAMWQFHIDEPGIWQVKLTGNPAADPDAVVAFGTSIAKAVALGAVAIVVGILLLLAGIITLIVGLVIRRRHKQELRTGGYGPAPPATGPGWPGPAPAPAPPGGAGGWSQPQHTTVWPPGGGAPG